MCRATLHQLSDPKSAQHIYLMYQCNSGANLLLHQWHRLAQLLRRKFNEWPGHRVTFCAEKLQLGLRPLDNVTVVICDPSDGAVLTPGEEGEVCVAGPNVMLGYHRNPAATDEAIFEGPLPVDRFGPGATARFFRTGDLGRLTPEGELHITGRLKEQFKLVNGKFVVPGMVEDRLRMSRYIVQCLVHGRDRPHTVALVLPDWEACGELLGTTEPAAIRELVLAEMASAPGVPAYAVPKAVHLLPPAEELTAANGMLTPKLSMRRPTVVERYGPELDALYVEL